MTDRSTIQHPSGLYYAEVWHDRDVDVFYGELYRTVPGPKRRLFWCRVDGGPQTMHIVEGDIDERLCYWVRDYTMKAQEDVYQHRLNSRFVQKSAEPIVFNREYVMIPDWGKETPQ